MGYRHDRSELLDIAVELVLDRGIAHLTYGQVASRAGTTDRAVVYYFSTKDDLLGEVIGGIGERLVALVASAFGPAPMPARALEQRAWPVLSSAEGDRLFSVLFEVAGRTRRDRGPNPMADLVEGWVDWLAARVDRPDPVQRRATALAMVATLDGLLVMRHTAGPELAAEAAAALDIGPQP